MLGTMTIMQTIYEIDQEYDEYDQLIDDYFDYLDYLEWLYDWTIFKLIK